jgi:hypothetical protein
VMVMSPACDRAEMAFELSGPVVMSLVEVIVTSPEVCALMAVLPTPDTAMSPNALMVIGP